MLKTLRDRLSRAKKALLLDSTPSITKTKTKTKTEPRGEVTNDGFPFLEIPDAFAFQLQELVKNRAQIIQARQLISESISGQTQRIDESFQELRRRYKVPNDPRYVLHISQGEGDLSGFKYVPSHAPGDEPPEK